MCRDCVHIVTTQREKLLTWTHKINFLHIPHVHQVLLRVAWKYSARGSTRLCDERLCTTYYFVSSLILTSHNCDIGIPPHKFLFTAMYVQALCGWICLESWVWGVWAFNFYNVLPMACRSGTWPQYLINDAKRIKMGWFRARSMLTIQVYGVNITFFVYSFIKCFRAWIQVLHLFRGRQTYVRPI